MFYFSMCETFFGHDKYVLHSSAGFYYRCINYCIVGILAYNMFELIDDYFMYYNRNICISVCRKHGINHTL